MALISTAAALNVVLKKLEGVIRRCFREENDSRSVCSSY